MLWRHILPQIWPLLPVLMAFELSAAILLAAELGLLGVFIGGGSIYRVPMSGSAGDYHILTSDTPELGQLAAPAPSAFARQASPPLACSSECPLSGAGCGIKPASGRLRTSRA